MTVKKKVPNVADIDYWRQLDLFSPTKFGNKEVHVVGVGATGSWTAYFLAKIGVQNIHVWDFDSVEGHNLPNQIYRLNKDVGKLKVAALHEIIFEATGLKITIHKEMVDDKTPLKDIVFLMVDSMDDRKKIWLGAIKMKLAVELMIETRMAIDHGRIYTICPIKPGDVKFWEDSLYSDEESEPSACTNRSIAPTAGIIADTSIWQMIKWFNGEEYNRGLLVSCRPSLTVVL